MFLAPQHFQEWDRSSEAWQAERARLLQNYGWGFRELEIDSDSLIAGRLVVTRCSGLFADGTPFRAPDYDPLPEGRVVGGHFAAGAPFLDVYLAIPEYRSGSPNLSERNAEGVRPTRFIGSNIKRIDLTTGTNEREVKVGLKNLRILFSDEQLDGYAVLRSARLVKTGAGTLELADNFSPSCLSTGASPVLTRVMQRVVEMLAARSTALGGARRQRGAGAMEFGVADITTFWLLHTVNSWLPLITHGLVAKPHPEQCYQWLASLCGELITFLPTGHPSDLPSYQHDEPAAVFERLEQAVRQGLEQVVPSGFTSIPLEKLREYVWIGRMKDDRILDGSKLYLAIGGDVPESMIGTVLPQKVKIGSPNNIESLIGAALRGVALTHMTWVPSQIPARAGFHYFQLDTNSELWNEIRLSKAIALYLPAEYSSAKVDLLAVKEQ